MKTNTFISAVILTTSLLLTAGSAVANLLHVGQVSGSPFMPYDSVDIIYDDAQNLVWVDFTTSVYTWYDASDWAEGIDGAYTWDEDPLEFSGGWRLPTVDEFFLLWSEGLNNISEAFDFLLQADYWTATQQDPLTSVLFSMASGKSTLAESIYPYGYGIAVREVLPDSQVPEASSLVLLALGFLSLSGVIRFRKISGRG